MQPWPDSPMLQAVLLQNVKQMDQFLPKTFKGFKQSSSRDSPSPPPLTPSSWGCQAFTSEPIFFNFLLLIFDCVYLCVCVCAPLSSVSFSFFPPPPPHFRPSYLWQLPQNASNDMPVDLECIEEEEDTLTLFWYWYCVTVCRKKCEQISLALILVIWCWLLTVRASYSWMI